MSWIQTFSRRRFDLLNPNPDDILITDIARALSMQCRYVGHVDRFYSVAEHSVRIAREVRRRGGSLSEQRWGLLHDAAEAYLGDVSRPLKQLPAMQPYRDAEKVLMAAIAKRFGLEGEEPALVKALDTDILGTEVWFLKYPALPGWGCTTATGQMPAVWPGQYMLGWTPSEAERAFLDEQASLDEHANLFR